MKVHIEISVKSDVANVWAAWTNPEDIRQWNAASDDWHTTASSVDLRDGGSFSSTMAAKDGSMSFEFKGTFTRVVEGEVIEYTLEDGREVIVEFLATQDGVRVRESFDPETENDVELQRLGWQAILDNFARHVESKNG